MFDLLLGALLVVALDGLGGGGGLVGRRVGRVVETSTHLEGVEVENFGGGFFFGTVSSLLAMLFAGERFWLVC